MFGSKYMYEIKLGKKYMYEKKFKIYRPTLESTDGRNEIKSHK